MILVAVALFGADAGNWGMFIKALLCATFVLLTSPVGAHAVCRGAYVSGVPLADVSVEDAFVGRARTLRRQASFVNREESREETETQRT